MASLCRAPAVRACSLCSMRAHLAPWYAHLPLQVFNPLLEQCCWDCGQIHVHCLQALRASDCVVDDLDAAKMVFADDYCYYISWVGMGHLLGKDAFQQVVGTPGDHMLKARHADRLLRHGRCVTCSCAWQAHKAIMDMPRWRRSQGQDFVFSDPHPGTQYAGRSCLWRSWMHPHACAIQHMLHAGHVVSWQCSAACAGFAEGVAAAEWVASWCQALQQSIQLVPDRRACDAASGLQGARPCMQAVCCICQALSQTLTADSCIQGHATASSAASLHRGAPAAGAHPLRAQHCECVPPRGHLQEAAARAGPAPHAALHQRSVRRGPPGLPVQALQVLPGCPTHLVICM